ncbi:MAG TPA: hypothetical protein GXX39_01990 [Syntrophothermus lipocalidus]|nr:hypothetical protein [Syntrophothermus lipocalidus]
MRRQLLRGLEGNRRRRYLQKIPEGKGSGTKTVEHNTSYLARIIELLSAGGYNTLPWMAILVKN